MRRWIALGAILAAAGAALVYGVRHKANAPVGTGALWSWIGEAQHEASRIPSAATRVPDADEIRIGNSMAGMWPPPRSPADIEFAKTVDRVGQRVAAQARRKLPWTFHYLPEPGFFNAFALPGGHIVLGEGLALHLETEDELAAILGHEIEHVDRYHCADRIQVEATARSLPLGGLITLPVALFQAGYTKDQEAEADREGTALAVRAGYSPLGAVHAMQMLADRRPTTEHRASNPVEESAGAALGGVEEYFKSHPDPEARIGTIQALIRTQGWTPVPEHPLVPRAVPTPPPPALVARAISPSMLAGPWVLLSANGRTGRGTGRAGRAPMNRTKVYRTDHTWEVFQTSPTNGAVVDHYGGSYTLAGDAYTEKVTSASNARLINAELRGAAILTGDTLTLQFSNGAVETWKRPSTAATRPQIPAPQ